MTKLTTLTLAAIVAVPSLVLAQSASELDTNGDGVLTIDEVQASFPEVTSDAFTAMDLNADGALDVEEIAAAQEAGLMPPTEG